MTLWCTRRSMAAAVVMASLKICSHLLNGKLLVSSTLPRSYRSAKSVNKASISSRDCCTYPKSSMISASTLASLLIILANRKSRLAINNCCTSRLHLVNSTERPRCTSRSPRAHRQWVFPDPGLPNSRRFSRRSRKDPSRRLSIWRAIWSGKRVQSKLSQVFALGSRD